MQVSVAGLLKEPVGSKRSYQWDEKFIPPEDCPVDWVRGQVQLTRTDKGIWAHGALDSSVPCQCSRCLADFSHPVHLEFDEEFLPTVDIATGSPLPPPDPEEGAFTIDDHLVLDLREAVRQYAIMAVPINPLCRPECRGLCPICGRDLNQAPCQCDEQKTDPRWHALEQLLTRSGPKA
jgi:uncharacterized protein